MALGVYMVRTIKQVEKEMDMVLATLEKLQNAMTILMFERENLLAIQRGLEVSAEMQTEELIEKLKEESK
jgi:uncharacterized protein YoxC